MQTAKKVVQLLIAYQYIAFVISQEAIEGFSTLVPISQENREGHKGVTCTPDGDFCYTGEDNGQMPSKVCKVRMATHETKEFATVSQGTLYLNMHGVEIWDPPPNVPVCAGGTDCIDERLLFIADTDNNRVIAMTVDGRPRKEVTFELGIPRESHQKQFGEKLFKPQYMAISPSDPEIFYVTDQHNILAVNVTSGDATTIFWDRCETFYGLCFSEGGQYLFIASDQHVWRYNTRKQIMKKILVSKNKKWVDCQFYAATNSLVLLDRKSSNLHKLSEDVWRNHADGAAERFASIPSKCASHVITWRTDAQEELVAACEYHSTGVSLFVADYETGETNEKLRLSRPCEQEYS